MQGAGRLCVRRGAVPQPLVELPTWRSCRRGRWLCRSVRIACDRKSGAFGVGAVTDGVAATSARGRLPPQGNRKAGTGPGGRNGEVVENMETKTRKRMLLQGLRASGLVVAGIAILAAGAFDCGRRWVVLRVDVAALFTL